MKARPVISSLLDLAQESSSEKRRQLLQEISNLFVEGAEFHTDREVMLFGDVLGRLLDQVEIEDRVSFSERVAPMPRAPRSLVLKLAEDEVRVAAPVLRQSPVLTEDDLIDLASRKSSGHLAAISQRASLPEALT